MKRNIIGFGIIAIGLSVAAFNTDDFLSGVLFTISAFMLIASFLELRDYLISVRNHKRNQFYVMYVNGLTEHEIKNTLKISDKTYKKILQSFNL